MKIGKVKLLREQQKMANTSLPRVTIGLPVYNGEKLLPRALEALLSQEFTDFELLISDNGSSDSTESICRKYSGKDSRINYYRYVRNAGIIRSLGRLAEMARGEYFVYAFHNDKFSPKYIDLCVRVLDKNPLIVLCYGGTQIIDDNGGVISDVTDKFKIDQDNVIERYASILSNLNLCNCFHGLMRTEVLQSELPFESCAAADVLLLSKLILKGKFHQINLPLLFRAEPSHFEHKTLFDRYVNFNNLISPLISKRDFNSLPFCDFIYLHAKHVIESELEDRVKEILLKLTYEILFSRYKNMILWEVNYFTNFIHKGNLRYIWKPDLLEKKINREFTNVNREYAMLRLGEIEKLINYFPNQADLYYIAGRLLAFLGRLDEAKEKIRIATEKRPGHQPFLDILQTLTNVASNETRIQA
jgi:glycosyltransferase involved in cell wall biosynthesis